MGDARQSDSTAAAISESPSSSNGGRRSPTVSVVENGGGVRSGDSGVGVVTDSADRLQLRNGVVSSNGKKKALGQRCKDAGQKLCQKLRGGRHSKDDINLPDGNISLCTNRRSLSSDNSVSLVTQSKTEAEEIPSGAARLTLASRPIVSPSVSMAAGSSQVGVPNASNRALNGGYSAMFLNSTVPASSNTNRSGVEPTESQAVVQLNKSRLVNPPRRMVAPSLFPCFKKRQSSDSESDVDTGRGAISVGAGRGQTGAVSRELVQRLKSSSEEGGTSASGFISHFRAVNGMIAEPYPVHTQIEYTHYLVPDLLDITNAPYYWGVMDRFEAERLLENKPEGTFLLRDSAQSEYLFSVSFRRYGRSLHARIEQSRHRFSFDSHDEGVFSSESVTGLIDHYKNPAVCLFFEPQLSMPLKRNFPFSLQHMCRAVISQTLVRRCEPTASYGAIQSLNLPKSLAEFIEEYHYKHPVRVRKVEHTVASVH